MKISVVTITFHVKTADIMTVRSLTSVSGVVAVEMENGRLTDLMESASPEVKDYSIRDEPLQTIAAYLRCHLGGYR